MTILHKQFQDDILSHVGPSLADISCLQPPKYGHPSPVLHVCHDLMNARLSLLHICFILHVTSLRAHTSCFREQPGCNRDPTCNFCSLKLLFLKISIILLLFFLRCRPYEICGFQNFIPLPQSMITCTCIPMKFQLFSNAICRGKYESSASHNIFFFWFLSILFRSIQYLQLVKMKNPKEPRHLYFRNFNIHMCSTVFGVSLSEPHTSELELWTVVGWLVGYFVLGSDTVYSNYNV